MKKKFLTLSLFLASKEISNESFQEMNPDEQVKLLSEHSEGQAEYITELKAKVDGSITKEEIEKMEADLKEVNERETKAMREAISKQGTAITRMLDNMGVGAPSNSQKAQIDKFVADNHAEIIKMKNAGHGLLEMTVKVPEDITSASASNPDGIPEIVGVQMAPPSNVNLRGVIIDGLVTTFATSLAAYPYTDTVPKDGDYSFVGEGGLKPQMDFVVETRYAEPCKIAAHMILTDESVQDIPGLQSIANNYLRAKHDLKRQNGILFGTGLGDECTGATVYGRTFVAGGMANCVSDTNFMDVVNACITDIFTTHNYVDEMPYLANVVMVNPVDFYCELVAAKDGNGLPLYPMAGLFNRVTIGGATIIPFEDIPAGKIFVADLSKYNVTNYVGYTVRIGWINDQLITNKFTMVGESRFHAFVKKLDEQAFIYDDIATIKLAITV
jgi:hypothetical protein